MTDTTEFKRGDTVYVATYGNEEVHVPCPVCFGKRAVQVVLGDDSVVETPCEYCGRGYDGPRGWVTEYHRVAKAEHVVIEGVVVDDGLVRKVEYKTWITPNSWRCLAPENVFADAASAMARAAVIKAEADEYNAKCSDSAGKSTVSKISWSIGYHMSQAKEHRRQAEYHEARAVVLKGREKKPAATAIDGRVVEFV